MRLLGAWPGQPDMRRRERSPGTREGVVGFFRAARVGKLRQDRLCRRRPRRVHALRPAAVRSPLDSLSHQPGERRRGFAHDGPSAQRVHWRGHRPDAGAGDGQGPDPARGQGDRSLRRPAVGIARLHAAGGLPALGRIQDHPPAPPLPALADGTANRSYLAGRCRGGAWAPPWLHEPVGPAGGPATRLTDQPASEPVPQMYSARSRSRADFGLAPTICLTTWPPENTLMVGMAMIP